MMKILVGTLLVVSVLATLATHVEGANKSGQEFDIIESGTPHDEDHLDERMLEGAPLLLGLRDTCSKNSDCKSGLCTGRPGKTRKCRFCARKNEQCKFDQDCCQAEKFPGRYCKNGQCKKKQSSPPLMLAYSRAFAEYVPYKIEKYPSRYFAVDTSTADTSILGSLPDSMKAIDFDRTTGILYGQGGTGPYIFPGPTGKENWGPLEGANSGPDVLYKINADSGSVIEEIPLVGAFSAMKFVSGRLYAVQGGRLVTVNTTTGALTTVGVISQGIRDLAYDGTAMYGLSGSSLVTIDLDTARIKSGSTAGILRTCTSIEFGSDGVLYAAVDYEYPDSYGPDSGLYSLDKVNIKSDPTYIGRTGGWWGRGGNDPNVLIERMTLAWQ